MAPPAALKRCRKSSPRRRSAGQRLGGRIAGVLALQLTDEIAHQRAVLAPPQECRSGGRRTSHSAICACAVAMIASARPRRSSRRGSRSASGSTSPNCRRRPDCRAAAASASAARPRQVRPAPPLDRIGAEVPLEFLLGSRKRGRIAMSSRFCAKAFLEGVEQRLRSSRVIAPCSAAEIRHSRMPIVMVSWSH